MSLLLINSLAVVAVVCDITFKLLWKLLLLQQTFLY